MERMATWSRVGSSVVGCQNINDVLKAADLDYEVKKSKIKTESGIIIPGQMATVREDTGDVFGIVSNSYEICQNRDAFDFINYIDDVKFVKAGQTNKGLVYVIAELPEVSILGDSFKPHVIFQNGHNGAYSVKAAICPLRLVCQNQFNLAFASTGNTVVVRHSRTMNDKLIEARETMMNVAEYMKSLNENAEKYAAISFSENNVQSFVEKLFPISNDASERSKRNIQEKRDALISAYNSDDNQNFRGTLWGVVNAMSDYITHDSPSRTSKNWEENKFAYVTFSPVLTTMFNFLLEEAY